MIAVILLMLLLLLLLLLLTGGKQLIAPAVVIIPPAAGGIPLLGCAAPMSTVTRRLRQRDLYSYHSVEDRSGEH